jgi:predicted metal-dependent HD superfamily phosphohydrolase
MVAPDQLESLRDDWTRLLAGYGVAPADAYPVFDLLAAAYSAPDRHYHNLEHLAETFRVAARLARLTDDTGPVQLAVWFHDAVYDSRAADNEARSAELAVELLGPVGLPAAVLERVGRLIRATAHLADDRPPPDRETAVLLDADLAILGAAEDRYRRYATAIRQEYAWVPDPEYRAGRAAVLGRFLARPRIFWHDLLYREAEGRARANVRAELAALGTADAPGG